MSKQNAILRFSALGDLAAALPVIRAFHEQPLIITSGLGKALLSDEFDHFLLLDDKRPRSMLKLAWQIRQHRFEHLIRIQNNDRARVVTALSGAHVHNNDGVSYQQCATRIFHDIATKSGQIGALNTDITATTSDYIVFNCGSSEKWASKRLPIEKWRQFSEQLQQRFNRRIVLTGSAEERDYIDSIARELVGPTEVVAGKTSLGDLKVLLANACLTLSTDSAAMHLSAVQKTPTIGLFGPTNWVRSAPWGDWSTAIYDSTFYPAGQPPARSNPQPDNYFDHLELSPALKRLNRYLPADAQG